MSSEIVRKKGYDYAFDPSKCEECDGNCCRGESGYIWVNESEIEKIAEFLGLDVKIFKKDYLNRVKYRYSIKELKINGEYICLFFDEKQKRCKIYDVRPKQCRTFPFWEYFKDREDEVRRECIGIV